MSLSKKKYSFDVSHSDDKYRFNDKVYLNEMKKQYYSDIMKKAKKQIREKLVNGYIDKKAKKGKGSATLWSTKWLRKKIDSNILYKLILEDKEFVFKEVPPGVKLYIEKCSYSLYHTNRIVKIYASW